MEIRVQFWCVILNFAFVVEYFYNSTFQLAIDGVLMLLLQFNSTFQSFHIG